MASLRMPWTCFLHFRQWKPCRIPCCEADLTLSGGAHTGAQIQKPGTLTNEPEGTAYAVPSGYLDFFLVSAGLGCDPRVPKLSDPIPVFGISRTACAAFYALAPGCAGIGIGVGCATVRALPLQFLNRQGMEHIRRGIGIDPFALRAHHMRIPAGIFKFFSTSAGNHFS